MLPPHGFYLVRIDVFAEPTLPAVSSEELEEMDTNATIEQLINQLRHMSADDAQDQVFRRFLYPICAACQPNVLANPLGKPRTGRAAGEN